MKVKNSHTGRFLKEHLARANGHGAKGIQPSAADAKG
jgi:hypothetical protein